MRGNIINDELVEVAAKAYADHTEYYVQFHRGLSSPSADKIRDGMRKALEAVLTPIGWETEAEWDLEQRAFHWNAEWSEEETRKLIHDLWREYCIAASPPDEETTDA
jgi:hypothetical protein